ncbi:uncharacterized protein LOC118599976 isoform X2 [Oryzias melastigma]|uniref:uncharacterized protein LOC118599976 isoform X2 n=1 Tax=Oryzias melastigma TaxID=30732 RepID=UPI00168D5729|nr:uncharacterized protein LOC118599976 isoform X2 [Oryzias melastigma]
MALCLSLSWRSYLMETSNAASMSLRRLTSQISDHHVDSDDILRRLEEVAVATSTVSPAVAGTRMISADFLIPAQSQHPIRNSLHHEFCVCQTEAAPPGGSLTDDVL